MTYRYIYKITCTAGSFKDKFYFGQHTTDNLNDGYKGSGKKINDYYKKHSKEYIKEIISYHNSQEELNQAEYDIIKEWLGNPMCLNLCKGGNSVWNIGKPCTEEMKKHLSEMNKGQKPWNMGLPTEQQPMYGKHRSEETKRKISEANKGQIPWTKGKSPSEETRQKQRDVMKGRKPFCLGKHRVWNENHTSYHYE